MNEYNQTPHIIVSESTAELKRLAKMSLKGLWQKAIIGVIIFQVFYTLIPNIIGLFIPGFSQTFDMADYITDPALLESYKSSGVDYSFTVSRFPSFYQALITGPFMIGFIKYLLMIVRRREVNYGLLFKGFENLGKAFLLQLLISILSVLWCLPFILLMSFAAASRIVILGAISVIGIVVMVIWAQARYSMAGYYMADDWNLKVMECIRLSASKMKGNIGNYIYLGITFIGWYLLASFVSSIIMMPFVQFTGIVYVVLSFITTIPTYFVLLYFNITKTFFYEILSGHLVKQSAMTQNY